MKIEAIAKRDIEPFQVVGPDDIDFVQPPTNTTGINPTEYKVLIAPKSSETVTKGGIILIDQTVESEKYASVEGTIVAASPLAFTYATQAEWDAANAVKPKAGDRVIYAKYAGVRVKSPKDGLEYLLINDKDLVATIEE